MARVKIEDLKPEAKKLDAKEMKKLFGGAITAINSIPTGIPDYNITEKTIQLVDPTISSAPRVDTTLASKRGANTGIFTSEL